MRRVNVHALSAVFLGCGSIAAQSLAPPLEAHATAVALSACGSLAVVGTRGGVIYKYNVQSGIPRGSYPRKKDDNNNKKKKMAIGNIHRTTKALEKTEATTPLNVMMMVFQA